MKTIIVLAMIIISLVGCRTGKDIQVEFVMAYAEVFAIIKKEMDQPRELLETLTQSIAESVYERFTSIKEIEVRVEKKVPPIVGFNGTVAATYRTTF